jgi:ABC-type lipopolysaccharide export system ATPase subunit
MGNTLGATRGRDPARRARHELIRAVCDWVYFTDFGPLIFAGQAEDALGFSDVQRAYLGQQIPVWRP